MYSENFAKIVRFCYIYQATKVIHQQSESNVKTIKYTRKISAISAAIAMAIPVLAVASTGTSILAVTANVTTASIINTSQNDKVHSVGVGYVPYTAAFTPNGSDVYVTNTGGGSVSVIDAASEKVTDTINIGGSPYGVAVNPNGQTVYVTNESSNKVNIINSSDNKITSSIDVGDSPYDVAYSNNGLQAYVTNSGSNTVSIINTSTNTVSKTVTVGSSPEGVAFTPNGQYAFVTNSGDGTISVINASTGSVVKTITVGGSPSGISFNPSNNTAYVTNRGADSVQVLNTSDQTYTGQSIDVGSAPYNVVFGPNGHTAYAVNEYSDSVSVIDTATGQVIRTIHINHSDPTGIAISPEGVTGVYSASSEQQLINDGFGANSSAYGNSINLDGGTLSLTEPFTVTNPIYVSNPIAILNSVSGGTINNNGNHITLAGQISGPGALTLLGDGVFIVNGDNTYSGGTLINGGEEIISANDNLGDATSIVTLDHGEVSVSTPFVMDREIIVDPSGGTVFGPVSNSMDPSADNALDLMGNLTGQGMLDTNGTVFYNGISGPIGGVTVLGGLFEVGDSAHTNARLDGPVTVNHGAILRGHGTINGDVIDYGIVYPGGSIGKLTINGNYVQNSSGTLDIEITPNDTTAGTNYDQLNVTGSATLNGALNILQESGAPSTYKVGEKYDIVHAEKGITGSFQQVNYNPLFASYITPQVTTGKDNTYLTLAATTAPASAFSPATNSNDRLFKSGYGVASSTFVTTTSGLTAVNSLMDGAEKVGTHGVQFTNSHQGPWVKGFGGFGRANGAGVEDYGGIAGYGATVHAHLQSHLVLGAAFVGSGTGTNTAQQTVDGQSFGGFGYAIDTDGRWRMSATLGAGYLHQNSTRYIYPSNVIATGHTNGWYVGLGAQGQYLVPLGKAFLMPYGRISYLHTHLGGFAEQGAGALDIHYGGLSTSVAAFSGGLRLGYDLRTAGMKVIPWMSVGGTGYAGTLHVTQAETAGLSNSLERGLVAPNGALNTDAGITLTGRQDPWTVKVAYDGQFAGDTHFNTFDVLANYRW